MPVGTYGDLQVIIAPDTINAPGVIEFANTIVPVFGMRSNPLSGVIRTIQINGTETNIPRDLGHGGFREVDKYGDRTPQFQATRQVRIPFGYDAYDSDYHIKEDAEVDSQIMQAGIIRDKITAAYSRMEFQIVYDLLNSLKLNDTSDDLGNLADGILADVPATIGWDKDLKEPKNFTDKAFGWNLQKLATIKTIKTMGHMPARLVYIARGDTVHGFFGDEQAVNVDYSKLTSAESVTGIKSGVDGDGNMWNVVGDFPNNLKGESQGIEVKDVSVGGNTYAIANEFAFDPSCLRMTTSPMNPMMRIEVYRNPDHKDIRFRGTAYIGAGCVNPKGVVRIKNAVRLLTSLGAGYA